MGKSKVRWINITGVASLFILLFVYTAASKLQNLIPLRYVITQTGIGYPVATVLALLIPVSELLIALFLFVPKTRTLGLLLSFVLMSVFSLYVLWVLLFAKDLPCSCGGIIEELGWKVHFALNLLLTGLAFSTWRISQKIGKPEIMSSTNYSNNQA